MFYFNVKSVFMSNLINCKNMVFERAVTVSLFIIFASHFLGGVSIKWVRGLCFMFCGC